MSNLRSLLITRNLHADHNIYVASLPSDIHVPRLLRYRPKNPAFGKASVGRLERRPRAQERRGQLRRQVGGTGDSIEQMTSLIFPKLADEMPELGFDNPILADRVR
ncbi:MAG: hypothetical protein Q7Q71_16665 [Verrucomicrobiota bacterium JB023]|nr:hypothetical protein [Verrucomicrobiota bacterium JB023]